MKLTFPRRAAALARVTGLAALTLMSQQVVAQERVLTAAALRHEANIALNAGQPDVAATYAKSLLSRDTHDFDALLILARAARTLGEQDTALDASSRAWDGAVTPEQSFAAAMVRAQALSSAGRRTQSQLWLRRASEVAPTEQLRDVAVRDFRYVRARNPFSTQLTFSVAPKSNINNGSRADKGTYEIPVFGVIDAELDGAAVALSGTEVALGFATRYRLAFSESGQTDLLFSMNHKTYTLSDDAQDKAPGVEGSDFAFTSAQMSLVQRGFTGAQTRPFQLSASVGRTWYGGDAYMQFLSLAATQSWNVSPATSLSLSVGRGWQETLSLRTSDADSWDLGGGLNRKLENGNQLNLGLRLRESSSISANLDYRSIELDTRLALAKPVFGAQIEMGLSLGQKDHDRSPVAGRSRSDLETSARLTAVLPQYDYYGFVPTVTLNARQVQSDFGQYDTEEFGLQLGIRSAF
ncbi:hypothetical protein [Puniceibacterium sp. IMCC21224]|uniref:hypothetical protein n=1 Tax=Puniceibacterium sp. IMCC21224 TaxID=1618204 RepID=UPI00064E08C8|nr:hypothetical protein [Puniceibacterium sp. IMCC21224]KMK68926.1 hypothetical protein IMCC21224_113814 [Puniceibacterium sp. IMCC21224]